MSLYCRCTAADLCAWCDNRITDAELAADGYDFDPSGDRAAAAADRYEQWLGGDRG